MSSTCIVLRIRRNSRDYKVLYSAAVSATSITKSTTYLELRHFGFFLISQAVFDGPASGWFKSGQQVLQQVGLKHRPY